MVMPKRNHNDNAVGDDGSVGGDDSSSVSSQPQTRKRRKFVASPLENCQEIYDRLRYSKNEDGRLLCEMFIRLPNRRAAAEYYEVVKSPIDLIKIQNKIKSEEYNDVNQFQQDIELLVSNAKAFYQPDCQEYKDACDLMELFLSEKAAIETSSASANETQSSQHSRPRRGGRREEKEDEETEHLSTLPDLPDTMDALLEYLFSSVISTPTDDGRDWSEAFKILPSKQVYPQYYEVIKEPIDLRMIAQKIQGGQYSSLDDLDKDFILLTKNARSFNEPKSIIYQDAVFVHKTLKAKRMEIEQSRNYKPSDKARSKRSIDYRDIVESFACIEVLPDKGLDEEEEEEEDDEEEEVEGSGGEEENQEIDFEPIDQRHMQMQLYTFIVNYKNPHGQTICDPFLKLPSRKQYPDYYVEIKNPLSLFNIKTKIKRNHYKSLDQLANDFDLVFNNAQQYNIEESKIHRDAVKLQKCMRAKKEEFQRLEGQEDYADDLRPLVPQSLPPLLPQFFQNESQADSQASLLAANASRNGVPNAAIIQTTQPLLTPANTVTVAAAPGVAETLPISGHSPVVSALTDTLRKRAATGRRPLPPDEIRRKRITALYQAIHNYEEDGRFLREIFMVLPSKQDYPDYYQVIPEPIDLTTIKRKIDNEVYSSHHELVADLRLMFNNARHYNEENSQVYRDADGLERLLKKKLKNLGSLSGIPRQPKRKPFPSMRMPGSSQGHITPAPLQRRLQELFLTIRDYRDTSGRPLAAPFLRLPSRTDLPQYYEFIKKPIELETICTKIGSGKYQSLEELVMDLVLMFDNACKFNEPDSNIYRDALTLMRVCMDKRAAMLATASPEEQEDRIPDVQAAVQDIMTGIVTHLYYFRDDDGRQLTDSFAELAQQYKQQRQAKQQEQKQQEMQNSQGAGQADPCSSASEPGKPKASDAQLGSKKEEAEDMPLTLDQVKANVEARRYRRLDRLQDDVLEVFTNVRKISRSDSQAFEDSCTLHRMYLAIRDQLCRRGEVLQSPSLHQTELQLEEELRAYAKKDESSRSPVNDITMASDISNLKAEIIQVDGKSVDLPVKSEGLDAKPVVREGQFYDVGDFIYVSPLRPEMKEPHIGCIEDIRTLDGESQLYINWYYRPMETFHVQTRKFMEQEVFKSDAFQFVKAEKIVGRCHVMYVKEYIKQKPVGMEDKDVYVCESRYSTKHKAFKKIKIWPVKPSIRIQLMDRESICLPARVQSGFAPSMEDHTKKALGQNESDATAPSPPLDKKKQCVVSEDRSSSEGVIYYEQFVYENGFWVKVGDYVYVPSMDGQGRHIVRIDRMWKNTVQNVLYFSGPWFVSPIEIEHLPTRVFYSKEVFLSSVDHASHLLSSILGKCVVLALTDYAAYRPTEYNEEDVYLCESKYFVDEKAIRRLKKGLKKFQLSSGSLEDELYFFRKQINPKKEASPLLYQASQEPLCYDLIRNSHQGAASSFLSGDDDTRDSFTSSMCGAYEDMAGHLIPSSSVLDRTGKKRKLRKAPSGYVVFAGEVRKDLLRQRPDAAFGEISKEVGLMWRNLAQGEKDRYEKKAQEIKRAMEEEEAARAAAQQQEAVNMPPPGLHHPSPSPSPALHPNALGAVAVGSPVRVSTPMTQSIIQQQQQNLQSSVYQQHSQQHGMVQVLQPSQAGNTGVMTTTAQHISQQPQTQSSQQLVYQMPPSSQVSNGHSNGAQFVQMAPPAGGVVRQAGNMTQAAVTNHMQQVPLQAQSAQQQQQTALQQSSGVNGVAPRPPSPVFVSCPPRTTRVMHSEIYQKYIERVRRNADYLSDWPRQLNASAENTPLSVPAAAKLHQIGSAFLNKMPEKQEEISSALWALRDHLLHDALNIQMRELPLEEL